MELGDPFPGASSKDEDSAAGGSKQCNQSPPQLKPLQHKLRKKKLTTPAVDVIAGSSSDEEQVLLKFPNTAADHKDNTSKLVAPKRRRLDVSLQSLSCPLSFMTFFHDRCLSQSLSLVRIRFWKRFKMACTL